MTSPRPHDLADATDPFAFGSGSFDADQSPSSLDSASAALHKNRMMSKGWKDWLFPGIWLIYLGQTVSGVDKHSDGVAKIIGFALVVIFAGCYLLALGNGWILNKWFWASYGALIGITCLEAIFAHEDAFAMLVYVSVISVAAFRKYGMLVVAALTVLSVAAPALIEPWHAKPDYSMAITLPLVAVAMYGFFAIMKSNRELTAARTEVARLAAENERSRIARDLHDLLGHSLTTITVKSALAHRLADRDPAKAAVEISEVEALSRRTLSEVRAAVAGYRDVTLSGELATGRQVLRAAGFLADLPKAVDNIDPNYEELFGWVVREGVTNVVRHSRGATCTISVGRNWLEIRDDGQGGGGMAGSGLSGLRERVEAAGGTVCGGAVGTMGRGWKLRVDLPGTDVHRPASDVPAAEPEPQRTGS
ncbi:MAG: sensor histidine kinase [Jatrophihabitans sp.]